MRPRLRIVSLLAFPLLAALLVLALHGGAALAHEDDDHAGAPADLTVVAHRITGGASLLQDLIQSGASNRFHDRAHHFEGVVGERRDQSLADDWRELEAAFEQMRRERRGGEARYDFLIAHLREDMAEGDRLVASAGSGSIPPPPSGGPGRVSFIDRVTCVGTAPTANRCPVSRDTLTFRIPEGVTVIRRLDAEWRDFGHTTNAEVYVNDRMVWRTGVARDWDGDGTSLDVRIPSGSTLSIRSSNGEPIWIRQLTAETRSDAARNDPSDRDPWDFIWQNWQQ